MIFLQTYTYTGDLALLSKDQTQAEEITNRNKYPRHNNNNKNTGHANEVLTKNKSRDKTQLQSIRKQYKHTLNFPKDTRGATIQISSQTEVRFFASCWVVLRKPELDWNGEYELRKTDFLAVSEAKHLKVHADLLKALWTEPLVVLAGYQQKG